MQKTHFPHHIKIVLVLLLESFQGQRLNCYQTQRKERPSELGYYYFTWFPALALIYAQAKLCEVSSY